MQPCLRYIMLSAHPTCGEHSGMMCLAKMCAACLHCRRLGAGHTPAGAILELHHVNQAHVPRAQLLQPPELRQRQAPVLGLRRLERLPRLLLRTRAVALKGQRLRDFIGTTDPSGCLLCTVSCARHGLLVSASFATNKFDSTQQERSTLIAPMEHCRHASMAMPLWLVGIAQRCKYSGSSMCTHCS